MQAHKDDLDARQALKEDLARFSCRVHQHDDPPLFTREPKPAMQSVHWRWCDIEPLLERIGDQLSLGAGGPRRTLRLHNPGLSRGTTHTFWGSIQVILPGEVATAHRHTASALRFIMKGSGALTTVEGEQYPMAEGDLVLTPPWTWHDHEHRGDMPMIWLDVLDISLMHSLSATFFDPFEKDVQPVAALPDASRRRYGSGLMSPPLAVPAFANPLLTYPAGMAQAALREAAELPPDPHEGVVLEYRNPATGGPAMPTMGQRLQLLKAGFQGRPRRHTGSKLYYVIKGCGTTTLDEARYDWSAGDFMAIAPWSWHAHACREEAQLFEVNDLPTLMALGYYREERA